MSSDTAATGNGLFVLTERPRQPSERTLSATRALCNECGELVDAQIVAFDGQVWLAKWCAIHGRTDALISSSEDWYRKSLGYVKPATPVVSRCIKDRTSCPSNCGLCPGHEQHTCLPILEITESCDMSCPICLVDAKTNRHRSLNELRQMIDTLMACEGRLNMLTISGGEPTQHPDLKTLLELLDRPEIGVISLSTNGLRLVTDDSLLDCLRAHNVVVSLQYDGTSETTNLALRGDPGLGELKARVIERLLKWGLRISLTTTLARDVNEPELEGIMNLFFSESAIVSLMVQPLAQSNRLRRLGRAMPHHALTTPDVVQLLADHSRGLLKVDDFTPLPCSHPTCFTLSYLLKTLDGTYVPLSRVLPRDVYLDTIKNQALLNTDADTLTRAQSALYELWSSSAIVPNRDDVLKTVKRLLLDLNALGRAPSHRDVLSVGVDRIKSIFIHHFMDRYTFDLSRAMKCCNHYPTEPGRLVPACIRNNLPQGLKE